MVEKKSEANNSKLRLAYLDNLKVLMIIFVVTIHATVTYSGMGSWYYKEPSILGNSSFYLFGFYGTFTQAYFMSLLFMIAAYFVPDSLKRKGVKKFIRARFYRLGIPILIYVFLINPLCDKLAHPNINLVDYYLHGIRSFDFLSWTGPLWFALVLLIFTLMYVVLKPWCDKLTARYSFDITIKNVLFLIILISIFAFIIRLIFPIGSAVINLQFCYFSAYIFMFSMGIIASKKNNFDKIDYHNAKKWFFYAFGVGIPLWLFIVYFGITRTADMQGVLFRGKGGMNIMSFLYAFWESFFCVTIIIALIGIFKKRFNSQNSLQKFLSTNCFGVYVFHAPILIGISLLLKTMVLPPILKCIIVSAIVISITYMFVWLIKLVPLLRKIFS